MFTLSVAQTSGNVRTPVSIHSQNRGHEDFKLFRIPRVRLRISLLKVAASFRLRAADPRLKQEIDSQWCNTERCKFSMQMFICVFRYFSYFLGYVR